MYKIFFYKDKRGKEPVGEYVNALANKTDKSSRMKLKKFRNHIQLLSEEGLNLNEAYIKHVDGDIWKLRLLRDRLFFAVWHNEGFILLHCFTKKTQKTPEREKDIARRYLKDIIDRGITYT